MAEAAPGSMIPVRRKLRASQLSPKQASKRSPSSQRPAQMGAPAVQPKVSMKPLTSSKATRPRVFQRPMPAAAHENDDQVGGGPSVVAPEEILRLQANRPDERQ